MDLNLSFSIDQESNDFYLLIYYEIQIAYRILDFILQVKHKRRNDFLEMMIHHTVTLILFTWSYYVLHTKFGIIIAFLHDVSDVTTYLVKLFVDTKYTTTTLSLYVTTLIFWFYFRLICFPLIIYNMYYSNFSHRIGGLVLFPFLLVLHVYWYVLLLLMGYKFIKTGKKEDIQQKTE
jgi:hypothetical protein